MVLPLSAGRIRIWGLDLREWRVWRSTEVGLLMEGRDLVKLGWEIAERMWEKWSSRGWEEGSLGLVHRTG